ncbi:MAG: hypothetical protein K2X03_14185 [Bryobacteraceae bacterium]|nr:hypothetical protein [Bryobacteraceae bacterium]
MSSELPLWQAWIKPAVILEQVWNTAPYLRDRPAGEATPGLRLMDLGLGGPLGFLTILQNGGRIDFGTRRAEQLEDYFALCLSAHHATVATFVPTDVDTKIRGLLWRETRDPSVLARMLALTQHMGRWTLQGISTRVDEVANSGPVSGHDGERLGALAGGLGRLLALQEKMLAEAAEAAIDEELEREAVAFRIALHTPGQELLALRLAMSLTHNVGDLDQGLSFWDGISQTHPARARFERLAHENQRPYQGSFAAAAAIYKTSLAAEGHRHYPLRPIRGLRQSPDLLLPLGPCLDDWGALIGRHPALTSADRVEILAALVTGCKKVPNQSGYFRALAGWREGASRTYEAAVAGASNAVQKLMREAAFRQMLAVPRVSFESALKKRVLAVRQAN